MWPDVCHIEGTNPSLDIQVVPLLIPPRSCRMPLLPRHTAAFSGSWIKMLKWTGLRTDPCSSPHGWWCLGRLEASLSLTIQPSFLHVWFSCVPVFSLSLPSVWTLRILLIVIIVVLLSLPLSSLIEILYMQGRQNGSDVVTQQDLLNKVFLTVAPMLAFLKTGNH